MSYRLEDLYHQSFTEEQLEEEAMYNKQLAEHYGYTI